MLRLGSRHIKKVSFPHTFFNVNDFHYESHLPNNNHNLTIEEETITAKTNIHPIFPHPLGYTDQNNFNKFHKFFVEKKAVITGLQSFLSAVANKMYKNMMQSVEKQKLDHCILGKI